MQIELLHGLHRGGYVQFDIAGDEKKYTFWAKDSLFLEEPVYGVFVNFFKRSNEKLNYYGPTLYSGDTLERLDAQLQMAIDSLTKINDSNALSSFITESNMGQNFLNDLQREGIDFAIEWDSIRKKFLQICRSLSETVHEIRDREGFLWVLGI